jgi:hypothetical protein
MIYDFIGDIHGHAEKLKALLKKLGYRKKGRSFAHIDTGRMVVFLGDFIDRGPAIRETLGIARNMVDSGAAHAVMGNHEYNAICFHTPRVSEPMAWMRRRTDKNIYQYLETLYQFRDHRRELEDYLRWFRALPFWIDLNGVRGVHAAWDVASMRALAGYPHDGRSISDELLRDGTVTGSCEYDALQALLKGIEINLPEGVTFTDKDGNVRTKMRVRWWLEGRGKRYGELTFRRNEAIEDEYPDDDEVAKLEGYYDGVPVLFGHYWFSGQAPSVLGPKTACLDYSVASGGFLTAYTWRGEKDLDDGGFTIA